MVQQIVAGGGAGKYRRPVLMVLVGLLVAGLAACYVPDNFKSEIRLGRNGDYALGYWGDLIWAPLYRDIARNALSQEEITKKIGEIQKDLTRDSHFSSVESLGKGRFKVAYETEGHLKDTDIIAFVRRNAVIIEMIAKADGTVIVTGNTMKPTDAQTANDMGLNVQGEFRVITDAKVLEHNASEVKPFNGYLVYIWNIQNAFSPAPHLVMRRDGTWPSKEQTPK